MNTPLRRTLLGLAAALGVYVGLWAYAAPDSFSRSFPGLGLRSIDAEGAYGEHLIRDVGALAAEVAR